MIKKLQDKCSEYKVKVLTEEDRMDIFKLYISNPDYFDIVEARPPKLEDCINDLTECPPTLSKEKKFFIGFYKNKKLFSVVDYLMGYPDEDIFYIGLYMIEGKNRAKGYGTKLLSEIIEVATDEGFKKLWLGVVSENLNAVNFWTKNGLKEIKKVPRKRDNGTVAEVIVMEKELISE
ncbi:MAG: GCN5-related N-acetyltransferase [Bacillales bacterium]|nr:GCN5-related N-acetyltransferase [Bacillales bacterium]